MPGPSEKPQKKPLRVLLVADAGDASLLLLRALRAGGFSPASTRIATEADLRAALAGQEWDVVIVDDALSGFDAGQALALVQERDPDLPCLVVTAQAAEAAVAPVVTRELRRAARQRRQRQSEEALAFIAGRLNLIARATRAVVGAIPLAEQVRALAQEICSAFQMDACVVRTLDGYDLVLLASVGLPESALIPRLSARQGIAAQLIADRQPLSIPDVRTHPATAVLARGSQGYQFLSYAGAPMLVENKVVGIIGIYAASRPRVFSEADLEHLQIVANHIAVAAENDRLYRALRTQTENLAQEIAERRRAEAEKARLLQEAQASAAWQRKFLREVLESVTGHKLRLCDAEDDLPRPLEPDGLPLALSEEALYQARNAVRTAARASGLSPTRVYDLVLAFGETAMNAVVHAGGGEARLCRGANGRIQIWVRDQGAGIAMDSLHRATLERGYTTAGTMGHGFWMVLQTIDRIFLLTGPTGTTVVLEQEREPPEPDWL